MKKMTAKAIAKYARKLPKLVDPVVSIGSGVYYGVERIKDK